MNGITNIFASYLSSVYDTNNFIDIDLIDMPVTHSQHFFLNNCIISENEIIEFLGSLSDNASAGPDGIPPLFLKMCRYIITKPLCYLFNLSLSNGIIPEYWKKSFISPILKSGNKNNVRSYRPISKL